jgi:hypothetical protein
MKAPLNRRTALLFSRPRLWLYAMALSCVLVGATPGIAGAVNLFTLDSSPDGRAGVAVDSAGTGYFAWEHKVSGTSDETRFCKLARGGSCTSPIILATPPLNPAPYDSVDVSAAFPVLGAGSTVYVVGPRFVAGDVVVWTSTDGGATFGPAAQATQSGAYSGTNPTDVLMTGGDFFVSSHNPGLNFTAVPPGSPPATGADLTPAGGLTNITGSSLGLANGGSGNPVEAFSMANGSQPQTLEFRSYSGTGDPNDAANWSAPAQVATGTMPSLAGGPKGLFLSSQDAANGTYTPVRVRKYTPGSGFGAPVTLQTDTSNDNAGSIFQTPGSGQLLVAWQGIRRSDGGTAVHLYRSIDGGATFANVGDVAEGSPNYAIYPESIRVAAADDGQGFVSFVDYGGGQQVLRVADLAPIPELTLGAASVTGSTITASVTLNTNGTLAATSSISNSAALAATARKHGCRKGQALLRTKQGRRCVSSSFGAKRLSIPRAGKYTVRVSPNATSKRALAKGKSLHVAETLTFTPAHPGKPLVKTFTVTVRGHKAHKKH